MGLALCLIDGCPGFCCVLISVSLIVRFVFNNISNFVHFLSFSDLLSCAVVLSIFCIAQLNSFSQSLPSIRFMSSRSVIGIDKFFLFILFSASSLIFPANITSLLLTCWYFLVVGNIFLSLSTSLSGCNIVTGDPYSKMNFFWFRWFYFPWSDVFFVGY